MCPPNAMCVMADKAGVCTASASQKGKVFLWERSGGLVSPGESVVVTWVNATEKSIFLPGCSTYNVNQSDSKGGWKDLGPSVTCVWEGNGVEVPAGGYYDTTSWTAPNDFSSTGSYKFTGGYAIGCKAGMPLSTAGCTSTKSVESDSFTVGLAP